MSEGLWSRPAFEMERQEEAETGPQSGPWPALPPVSALRLSLPPPAEPRLNPTPVPHPSHLCGTHLNSPLQTHTPLYTHPTPSSSPGARHPPSLPPPESRGQTPPSSPIPIALQPLCLPTSLPCLKTLQWLPPHLETECSLLSLAFKTLANFSGLISTHSPQHPGPCLLSTTPLLSGPGSAYQAQLLSHPKQPHTTIHGVHKRQDPLQRPGPQAPSLGELARGR